MAQANFHETLQNSIYVSTNENFFFPIDEALKKTELNELNLPKNCRASQILNIGKDGKVLKKDKYLSAVHLNINGLNNKNLTLAAFLKQHKPTFFGLNELKCDSTMANNLLRFNNYTPYYKCREKKGKKKTVGGGVALLVEEGWDQTQIFPPTDPRNFPMRFKDVEAVIVKITINNSDFHVVSMYVAPDKPSIEPEFLKYLNEKYENIILLGDLNAKIKEFTNENNKKGLELKKILEETNFKIINDKKNPTNYQFWEEKITKVQKKSTSMIDYIITSGFLSENKISYSTLRESIFSIYQKKYFHIPIRAIFKIVANQTHKEDEGVGSFLYDKANWQKLNEDISETCFINCDNLDDLDRLIEEKIRTAAIDNIPRSSGKRSSFELPEYILKMNKFRKKLQRRYNKNKTKINRENLYEYIDFIQCEIKHYKSCLWNIFINKIQAQNKYLLCSVPFWRRINNFRNKKTVNKIGILKIDGKEIKDDGEKANLFASRLKNIFSNGNENHYDNSFKSKVDDYFDRKGYESEYTIEQKEIKLVSLAELECALKDLNSKSSLDEAMISNKILKNIKSENFEIFLKLFNECLKQNKIPSAWKISRVVMIKKKDDDLSNIKNYRPISVTLCIARLFERIMLRRLQAHLKKNKILIKNQSGFRQGRQTKDNILFLAQKVKEQFNVKNNVLAVFFDIASAFDKVWHRGLMLKLIAIKTPYYLLKIIMEFLDNRKFFVQIGNSKSIVCSIEAGVPQGGVLSPTLFSIYINDIPLLDEKNGISLLFADDLVATCNYKKKCSNEAKTIMQDYLVRLEAWSGKWRLTFAPLKCNTIVFTNQHSTDKIELVIYGTEIPQVEECKFLGIIYDKKLTFKSHFEKIEASCEERLKIIRILVDKFWCLDKKVLLSIYKLLIRSLMEYSSILFPITKRSITEKLQKIQNECLRLITGLSREDGNILLHEETNMDFVYDRMTELNRRYFTKAEAYENEIIKMLIDDYNSFYDWNLINKPTILCYNRRVDGG
jgi:exonuclease III